jgi:hypothetical protein
MEMKVGCNVLIFGILILTLIISCNKNENNQEDQLSEKFDLIDSTADEIFFLDRFNNSFWKNNEIEDVERILSFDSATLFKMYSIRRSENNPKWYCYFWQQGTFQLDFYSEGYETTIFEISKNQKNLLEINETSSYTNTKGIKEVIYATISFEFLETDRLIRLDIVCDGKSTEPVIFSNKENELQGLNSVICSQVYVIGGC